MERKPFLPWDVTGRHPPLSRRRFLHTAAGTLGALGASFLWPSPALAAG